MLGEDLRRAGLDQIAITPSHEAAPGLHSAIVRAVKPEGPTE
jgi:hypothetical protein